MATITLTPQLSAKNTSGAGWHDQSRPRQPQSNETRSRKSCRGGVGFETSAAKRGVKQGWGQKPITTRLNNFPE
jgi:hypothetical protein